MKRSTTGLLLLLAMVFASPLFLATPVTPTVESQPPLSALFAPPVAQAAEAEAQPEAAPVARVDTGDQYPSREARLAAVPAENPSEEAMLVAAREFGIPTDVALALMGQESGGNPNAVSSAGATGLGQVMPGTAAAIAARLGVTSYDMTDPATNARFSMFYLKEQWDKEGDLERALRAYNAGPGAIDESLAYPETNNYVASIFSAKDRLFDRRANVPTRQIFRSGVQVTQGISEGNHNGTGYDNGLDLVPLDPTDTTVRASFDGKVFEVIDQPDLCGNGVVIESPSGLYRALYCHLAAPTTLTPGATVVLGDVLGLMGESGLTYGAHTHFSVVYLENGAYTTFVPKE